MRQLVARLPWFKEQSQQSLQTTEQQAHTLMVAMTLSSSKRWKHSQEAMLDSCWRVLHQFLVMFLTSWRFASAVPLSKVMEWRRLLLVASPPWLMTQFQDTLVDHSPMLRSYSRISQKWVTPTRIKSRRVSAFSGDRPSWLATTRTPRKQLRHSKDLQKMDGSRVEMLSKYSQMAQSKSSIVPKTSLNYLRVNMLPLKKSRTSWYSPHGSAKSGYTVTLWITIASWSPSSMSSSSRAGLKRTISHWSSPASTIRVSETKFTLIFYPSANPTNSTHWRLPSNSSSWRIPSPSRVTSWLQQWSWRETSPESTSLISSRNFTRCHPFLRNEHKVYDLFSKKYSWNWQRISMHFNFLRDGISIVKLKFMIAVVLK